MIGFGGSQLGLPVGATRRTLQAANILVATYGRVKMSFMSVGVVRAWALSDVQVSITIVVYSKNYIFQNCKKISSCGGLLPPPPQPSIGHSLLSNFTSILSGFLSHSRPQAYFHTLPMCALWRPAAYLVEEEEVKNSKADSDDSSRYCKMLI